MSQEVKTIVIIDDHDIVRYGLEMLINECSDLRVAGTASTLRAGLELIARLDPDLVITDLGMPDSHGLDTVRQLVAAQRNGPTLVLSMQDEMLYGEQVIALGAAGYLMKEAAHGSVIAAARAVLAGETWTSARLRSKLIRKATQRRGGAARNEQGDAALTLRELELMEMLKKGKTTKEIAAALDLSIRTVDIHRANIKRKLHLRTGAELIAYASNRL
jgi:DNA-binding NarL/FixJ family response regulator